MPALVPQPASLAGLQNADLEVAEAAWDFFRAKRKQKSPHRAGFVTA